MQKIISKRVFNYGPHPKYAEYATQCTIHEGVAIILSPENIMAKWVYDKYNIAGHVSELPNVFGLLKAAGFAERKPGQWIAVAPDVVDWVDGNGYRPTCRATRFETHFGEARRLLENGNPETTAIIVVEISATYDAFRARAECRVVHDIHYLLQFCEQVAY